MDDSNTQEFGNRALLVDAMGRWPSFHDAHVMSFTRATDVCEATIHVHEMTREVDQRGYYVLTNHHLVTLRMSGVRECTLPADYKTDILFGLSIERVGQVVELTFHSVTDESGCVLCEAVTVMRVIPCDANGECAI